MKYRTDSGKLEIDSALRDIIRKCLTNGEKICIAPYYDGEPFTSLAGAHCHSHWEMFAVMNETFAFKSISSEYKVFGKGSLILVPPGCPHTLAMSIKQPEKQKVCVLSLPHGTDFHGTFSWMLGGGKTVNLNTFTPSTASRWKLIAGMSPEELFSKASRSIRDEHWGKELACSIIRAVLASLGEALNTPDTDSETGQMDRRIIKILAILQKEYHNPELSTDALATEVGLSKAHLFDLFKSVTGNTMHQSLMEIRLRRAMELIEAGRYSIKEVAGMTGWQNQLYFSTAFRKHYGAPPSAFAGKSIAAASLR